MNTVGQIPRVNSLPFERELVAEFHTCPRCGGSGRYTTRLQCLTCGGLGRRFSVDGRDLIRSVGVLLALNVVFDSKDRLDVRAMRHVRANDLRPGMLVEEVIPHYFPRTDERRTVKEMKYHDGQVLITWESPAFYASGWVPESVQFFRTLTDFDIDRAQVWMAGMLGRGAVRA